jgi:outer membrane cobalamin receptor
VRFRIQIIWSVFLLSVFGLAAELQVKVVDPNSVPVLGAEVDLLPQQNAAPIVSSTSAAGIASFPSGVNGPVRVRVLAPGFAEYRSAEIRPAQFPLTITLGLAPASETVVVTATRTPVSSDEVGASVDTLSGKQIETMQPVGSSDAIRFLPGAVVDTAGQRGGLASLFVRGGDSRYNKVIIDGVPVNDPGGTFNFGVVPLVAADRLEFVRGAHSTLYGSDAMTSVVQVWTQSGSTRVPELRFAADGGNFGTAHGYMSLAGARGAFDYDVFGDQFNTAGNVSNDDYSNSTQGANLGAAISPDVMFRFRVRHSNSRTGVQGEWNFNGSPLQPPDSDQLARENDFLSSAELTVNGPAGWQHRFLGFEYNHVRSNLDSFADPGRLFDFGFHSFANINRAGFEYQGDYVERSWARTTIGYQFEDENGFVGDLDFPPLVHGLRLNHAVYGEQVLTKGRVSAIFGARFVHNQTFGNKGVPRAALTFELLRGGEIFSGTQLRASYATGIKEPRLEESFARGQGILPSPNLKAEENRAFEAGIQQNLFGRKYSVTATYYNNLFRNQIDFAIIDPVNFIGQYQNIDKSIAHGAEIELHGRPWSRLSVDAGYNYTSTQILAAPFAFDALQGAGRPLLRRPKHSGSLLLTYLGKRWGGSLGGSFVGRRPDSDFLGFGIDHAAGYALVNLGAWYSIHPRVTAYVNIENLLDRQYNEVVGYPALGASFRAGMRFRIGGE